MPVLGGLEVPNWRVEHAANVFAQYLDWDADGRINNEEVHKALLEGGAIVGLFPYQTPGSFDPQENKDEYRDAIVRKQMVPAWVKENMKTSRKENKIMDLLEVDDNSIPKSIYIIRVPVNSMTLMRKASSGPTSFIAARDDEFFDGALEEIMHMIFNVGYQKVYPHVFRAEPPHDSLIARCMVEAVADCGYAFNDTMKYPHCRGDWHYDDKSCAFGCLIDEYIFRSLVTLLGGFDGSHNDMRPGACKDMRGEWSICTPGELHKYEPSVYELYDVYGKNPYGVPAVLPNGNYRPKSWPNMSLDKRYHSTESQKSKDLFFHEQQYPFMCRMIKIVVVAAFVLFLFIIMRSKHFRGRVGH